MSDKDNFDNSFCSALTIDVEDGINIAMQDSFQIKMPPTNRILDNVGLILNLFEINNVRATFFILGEIAETFPHLVKKIESFGHEIGIHGYYHTQIFRLTPQKFRFELKKAKDLVECLIGHNVIGFRAPAFSINRETSWAFNILAECGFNYDSSVFPSVSPRYGWNGFSREICKINLDKSISIIEVPLSVIQVFGWNFPVCGGGYLRYFPYYLTKLAFKSNYMKRPVIIYIHPYELDIIKYPDYFYEARSKAQLKKRLQLMFYRYNKDTVKPKLENLLKEFKFAPLYEIISDFNRKRKIQEIRIV